jgi:UDP-N-acetylmuramate dehydrogenase
MNLSGTMQDNFVKRIRCICADVREHVLLAKYSRWKVGGPARCVAIPSNNDEVVAIIRECRSANMPYVVIGASTNLLFSDEGLDVLLVVIGEKMSSFRIDGSAVVAQAGIWVPKFSQMVARLGYAGVEHMTGIPGTLGGLLCMNGGSQRKGVGDHVKNVQCVSVDGILRTYTKAECEFAYRSSIFQCKGDIVVGASFEYPKAEDKRSVLRDMRKILEERRKKFPLKLPNCGSVFVSNPAMYADYGPPGAIIEGLGFKGLRCGGARVSDVHANFIVNYSGATAADILWLINTIQCKVVEKTGYRMPAEVRYVSRSGKMIPADIRASEVWGPRSG